MIDYLRYVAIDFETNAIQDNNRVEKILGMAWTKIENGKPVSRAVEWDTPDNEGLGILEYLLENYIPIFHSSQFELYLIEKKLGLTVGQFHDTQIMSYVLNPNRSHEYSFDPKTRKSKLHTAHSLGAWGVRLGDYKGDNSQFSDWAEWTEKMAIYARQDTSLTFKVFEHLYPELLMDTRTSSLYHDIDLPFSRAVVEMQQNGLRFNKEKLQEFTADRAVKAQELEKKMWEIYPLGLKSTGKSRPKQPKPEDQVKKTLGFWHFNRVILLPDKTKNAKPGAMATHYEYLKWDKFNPSSSTQVATALKELYDWEPEKLTDTGKPAVGADVLETLDYPLAQLLARYAKEKKLVDSFGESLISRLDEDSRVYPNVNNCLTKTGRLSSSNPNAQQFPARGELGSEFRHTIEARPGYKLLGVDKAGFQLKILAYMLHSYVGKDEFWDLLNSGAEQHAATASIIFDKPVADVAKEERQLGKTFNFALAFGAGAGRISATAASLGIKLPIKKSVEYVEILDARMGISKLKNFIWERASEAGGIFYDLFGRRLVYPDLTSNDKDKVYKAQLQVFNAVIQGTEASLMKVLILQVLDLIKLKGYDARLLIAVHDEILLEVVESQAEALAQDVTRIFSDQAWLPGYREQDEVATYGDNWADCK